MSGETVTESDKSTTSTSRASQTSHWMASDLITEPHPCNVDVHELFGLPRPKRPSEKSEEDESEESESDEDVDSDDDLEEWQEGEYLVLEEDEERKEMQIEMLSENSSVSRDMLRPIFTACTVAYEKWICQKEAIVPEGEIGKRQKQLTCYQRILELYGNDAEWQSLTHEQRVDRNKEVHLISLRAKELGLPPEPVTQVSVMAGTKMAPEMFTMDNMGKQIEDSMKNRNL